MSEPLYLFYVTGDVDLSFVTAIDFTGSNGESSSFFTFHTNDPEKKKAAAAEMYDAAVKEIGSCLETYDSDGKFPAYGFQGEHCFPLNGIEAEPNVQGIDGMISAFHQALSHVKLLGSTQFEPVIERAAKIAALPPQHGEAHKYVAMIILTDGKFSDQQRIVEAMATVSSLPITFVYVVVGEDPDGENTKVFEKLKSASRTYTNRDMIQVIQMHSLTGLSANARSFSIARQMIKELPTQLVTYYTSHNIMPSNTDGPAFGVVSLLSV